MVDYFDNVHNVRYQYIAHIPGRGVQEQEEEINHRVHIDPEGIEEVPDEDRDQKEGHYQKEDGDHHETCEDPCDGLDVFLGKGILQRPDDPDHPGGRS